MNRFLEIIRHVIDDGPIRFCAAITLVIAIPLVFYLGSNTPPAPPAPSISVPVCQMDNAAVQKEADRRQALDAACKALSECEIALKYDVDYERSSCALHYTNNNRLTLNMYFGLGVIQDRIDDCTHTRARVIEAVKRGKIK